MKTYYEVLGLDCTASQAEIEQACWARVKELGLEAPGDSSQASSDSLREIMCAYQILSRPGDGERYDRELVTSPQLGSPEDLVSTGQFVLPSRAQAKVYRGFDVDGATALSVLRTGGGALTFRTTLSGQVLISGNPPPYADIREGELMIAASDFPADICLPRRSLGSLVVRSHMGRIDGLITHTGTIQSHDTQIDLELGGGLDLDLSRCRDCAPVSVTGMTLDATGLHVPQGLSHAETCGTLAIEAVGGSIGVRYTRIEFEAT